MLKYYIGHDTLYYIGHDTLYCFVLGTTLYINQVIDSLATCLGCLAAHLQANITISVSVLCVTPYHCNLPLVLVLVCCVSLHTIATTDLNPRTEIHS